MTADGGQAGGAHEHYLRVRGWARRMLDSPGQLERSEAEQAVSRALAPLWDASPDTIAGLRRWAEPFGGASAADYDAPESRIEKAIRRDLKRLFVQVGRDLFVEEPSILGGFGCRTSAGRCNADTLRFFSALVALQDGAVLPAFQQPSRRIVWEIGGGWGGFAYQFKTICPNVTYLITGRPDTFLVSAVYLMTAFPGARCRFFGESSTDALWNEWENVDFVFAPEEALDALRPPRLDLTLDVMTLRQVTPERVEQHVRHAFETGCRYLYSLHQGDWADGEPPALWRAFERLYWLHPVPSRVELRKTGAEYSHLVGWRRRRA